MQKMQMQNFVANQNQAHRSVMKILLPKE